MFVCIFLAFFILTNFNKAVCYELIGWDNITMYTRAGESLTIPVGYTPTPAQANLRFVLWLVHADNEYLVVDIAENVRSGASLINSPEVTLLNVTPDLFDELLLLDMVGQENGSNPVIARRRNITLIDIDLTLSNLLNRLTAMESQVNQKNDEINQLNTSLKALEDRSNQMTNEPVAFYSQLFKYSTFVGENNHFIFSYVGLNQGGGYDLSSGYFTVPLTGYYYFAATTGGRYGYVGIYIAVDNVPVSNSSDTLTSRGWTEHTSTFLTGYMIEGQRVSVHTQSKAYYYRGDSSFMGFLISANGNQNLDP